MLTAWHTSSTLATFSEFGLIVAVVAVVGVDDDLLDPRWTPAVAVAVSMSFALAAPLNSIRFELYRRLDGRLDPLQRTPIQPDDPSSNPPMLASWCSGWNESAPGRMTGSSPNVERWYSESIGATSPCNETWKPGEIQSAAMLSIRSSGHGSSRILRSRW